MTDVFDLFRVEAGLLAFILAFYALCARENRAPYITHTVYSEIGLVLLAVFVTLLALVVDRVIWLSSLFRVVAQIILLVATIATIKRVYSIANRDLRLRDDRWWQVLPGFKEYYIRQRRRKHEAVTGVSYEHQSLGPSPELTQAVIEAGWPRNEVLDRASRIPRIVGGPELSATLSLVSSSYHSSDGHLLEVAKGFLQSGAYVQYTPCARHPMEFLSKLESSWSQSAKAGTPKTWKEVAGQVVVVDAYTPHFGFYDSVHEPRTKLLEKQFAVSVIPCGPTFAGIHTATAAAFNVIKAKEKGAQNRIRKPALLVFEAAYALVDLESPEQYRRFLRHVIPSERMWGSMFTLVIELGLDENSKVLLRGYSDYFLDTVAPVVDGGGVA